MPTTAEVIDFVEQRRLFGFAKRVSAARLRYEQETASSDNVEDLQRAFDSYIDTLMGSAPKSKRARPNTMQRSISDLEDGELGAQSRTRSRERIEGENNGNAIGTAHGATRAPTSQPR